MFFLFSKNNYSFFSITLSHIKTSEVGTQQFESYLKNL